MRKSSKLAIIATIALAVVGVGLWLVYPWLQAQRWERQITSSESFDEVRPTLSKMVKADSEAARAVLERLSQGSDRSAYDSRHHVLCCVDVEAGTTHLFTSTYSTHRCDPQTRFKDVRLVESVPEAVTFAMTDETSGKASLLVVAYKHSGDVCSLSPDELAQWQKEGFWNTYVQRQGDPVEAQKEKVWTPQDEQDYAKWREGA